MKEFFVINKKVNRVLVFLPVCIISVGLILGLATKEQQMNKVFLSEVCTHNDSAAYDKLGDNRDYIELYNDSDVDISLEGWKITDKANKYVHFFDADVYIPSKHYILVYAGDGSESEWTQNDSSYLGFRISDAESIVLSNNEGYVVDSVKLPNKIDRDLSYSCVSFRDSKWDITSPSPWNDNEKSVFCVETNEKEISFNNESGFYDEPIMLEMQGAVGSSIYYTLDGSSPSKESIYYSEPITIDNTTNNINLYSCIKDISAKSDIYIPAFPVDKGTIVRAVSYDENGVLGQEMVGTYFVGLPRDVAGYNQMSTISVVTDPDNLFGYNRGIYVKGRVYDMCSNLIDILQPSTALIPAGYNRTGKNWKRPAVIQYFDNNGELKYAQNVMIGIHGNWTTLENQKGFNIFALEEEGKASKCLFEGWKGYNLESLALRVAYEYDSWTKVRDVLAQEMVSDRAVLVSEYEPVQVFINGEYWGLYNLQERLSADMIAKHYNVNADDIVLFKSGRLSEGNEEYTDLWDKTESFIINSDLSDDGAYAEVQRMIDIQSYIDYCAVEVYTANVDSVNNNYAMWRTVETTGNGYDDGRWRWCLYDLDESADAVEWFDGAEADNFIECNWSANLLDDAMFCALLKNENFKAQFVASFLDIAKNNFNRERVITRIDELEDIYTNAAVQSGRRFVSEDYSSNDYHEAMERLRSFYMERENYIIDYMYRDIVNK